MFNRMINSFRQFMYGRYGSDMLNFFLCIFAVILSFLSKIGVLWFLNYISTFILVVVIYRTFSKNIAQRQKENYKFLHLKDEFMKFFNKKKTHAEQMKTYKFFKCPKCGQKIRIPKGRGTVSICCPKCQNNFTKKT